MKEMHLKKQKLFVCVVSSLLMLTLMADVGFAQKPTKAPGASARKAAETIKGTVDYNERLGGYFIRGVQPGGELFIVNQNTTVLKKLKESGKEVMIEGRSDKIGADYFIIEKIDGKKYSAAKTTKKKTITK